jgi:hypothetical protein
VVMAHDLLADNNQPEVLFFLSFYLSYALTFC